MSGSANSRVRNIVVLVALLALGSTAFGAPVPLTNGVPVSGLSGTTFSTLGAQPARTSARPTKRMSSSRLFISSSP